VSEWHFAQNDPGEELAQLHHFAVKKRYAGGEVEFVITVKEFAQPLRGEAMRFFAHADKQLNQKTAPFTPTGFGNTLFKALADCLDNIRQFPYEGP